jgi:hypothetical protein
MKADRRNISGIEGADSKYIRGTRRIVESLTHDASQLPKTGGWLAMASEAVCSIRS